jgi:hypothetical protein
LIKLAKEENHVTLFCRAKQNSVISKGLRLKAPFQTQQVSRITMAGACEALLREHKNVKQTIT